MKKKPECPICGGNNFHPKRHKPDYQIGVCNSCSASYMYPFIESTQGHTENSNSSITDAGYYSNIIKMHKTQSKLATEKAPKMLAYWNKIHPKKITSILEIGCGTGQYYEAWKELGIQWNGLEVSNQMIDFCSVRNIPVKNFFEHLASPKKYDIIFLSQVLEHSLEPNKFLQQLKNFMKEDTILHIDVPNHNSITSLYRRFNIFHRDFGFVQPYHHQIAYTKKALKLLMVKNAFRPINITAYANNHPIFGQLLTKISPFGKLIFFFSNLVGRGSILTCISKKHFN
jgi:2-polyprenyl-3-methyl-5-hydroxy-6-metoxy-1,4-benzoquinol methylase